MQWKGILGAAQAMLRQNKEAVLFGAGTVCLISTAVCSAKAAPEASRRVEEIKFDDFHQEGTENEHRIYRVKRYALEVVPLYVPAAIAGGLSVTAFGMSNRALAKRAAGAAAAYSVAEKMLSSYQDKVIEDLGQEAHDKILQAVTDEVPDDVMEKARGYLVEGKDTANLFQPDLNDKLYYDHVTGRMFWSTDEKVKDAESAINKELIDQGIATLNDFYAALLLDCDSTVGEALGWRVDDPHARNMDIIFGSKLTDDNTPLVTISYRTTAINLRELERR